MAPVLVVLEPQAEVVAALAVVEVVVVKARQLLHPVLAAEVETDLFVCFLGKEQK